MLRIYAEQARRRQATSTGGSEPQLVDDLPQAEPRTRDRVAEAIDVLSCTQTSYNVSTIVVLKLAIM